VSASLRPVPRGAWSLFVCVLAACGTDPAFTQNKTASGASPVKVVAAPDIVGKSQDALGVERDANEGTKVVEVSHPADDSPSAAGGEAVVAGGEAVAPVGASVETGVVADAGASTSGGSTGVTSGGSTGVTSGGSTGVTSGGSTGGTSGGSTGGTGGGRTGVPEDVMAPPADSVQTNVRFSQLRGDASYTNCLAVAVNNGANVSMGCNKDGTLQKNVAVLASPSTCNMISLQFKTNNNILLDTKQKVGVGRMQIQKISETLLEIGYEDSSDADFNDYIVRIEVPVGLKYFIQGTTVTNCE